MVTLYCENEENARKVILEEEKIVEGVYPYYVLDIVTYSSNGNEYGIANKYEYRPTDEDLKKLAEIEWKEYYEDQTDKEHDEVINELMEEYIVIERNTLFNPIIRIRREYELTQEQLSEVTGIPINTIRNWEQGQRECKSYIVELIKYKLENEVNYGKRK